ncbi:hypothetical protein EMCG_01960 [[Emmonsia] crescens]|uniref:Uncharacterized protein n=1 Tax=[Emmonsia] crescens TaxID=73230 RepID=A0A0G2J9C2_9EURO|nr:hypothetical protein EMCG_01960 [Emmonsia crescens UAMH 3008]
MVYFQILSATASKLKSSYKRISSYKGPDSGLIRSTVCRTKVRITRLSPQRWRTQKLSNRKVDEEAIGKSSPCASQHPSLPPLSSDALRDANDLSYRLSTQENDTSSDIDGECPVTVGPSPPIEIPTSPVIELSSNTLDIQDDDIEQAGTTTYNQADTVYSSLLLAQQQHANYIAALEDEYKDKLRNVVDEKDECMERLKNLTEERDALAKHKTWWQGRFVTVTKTQDTLIYDLKRDRNRFEASQKAAEARTKHLEALVEHQQAQLGKMHREMEESELQLEKVREELESSYQANNLLRGQIRNHEASAVKYFQVYHNVKQAKEQYLNLQSRYQMLEQQVTDANTNTLKAIMEVEKPKATKSELERGVNAAETQNQTLTLEQLEKDLAVSKNLRLKAEEREEILKCRLSTLHGNWRAKKNKYANDLLECQVELRLKDWIIEVLRQRRAGYINIVKEVIRLIACRVDGDKLALQLSELVMETLGRNEELNFHAQSSGVNGDRPDIE